MGEEADREDMGESPWERIRAGLVLGTEAFMEKVHERLSGKAKSRRGDLPAGLRANATLKAIVVATEGERGEKVGTFRDRYGDDGRDLILWLARANTDLTLGQLGSWAGGVGGSSVSMAIARVTALPILKPFRSRPGCSPRWIRPRRCRTGVGGWWAYSGRAAAGLSPRR